MSATQLPFPGLATGVRQQGRCPMCAGIGALTATDIFCGAGGSSNGLEWVRCPGCGRSLIRVTQAINHWDLAVQAHNANFPHADHDVHDVEVIPASRFRRTDILWASPECTHHAYCRGPKQLTEEAFRSRATFADIIRFTARNCTKTCGPHDCHCRPCACPRCLARVRRADRICLRPTSPSPSSYQPKLFTPPPRKEPSHT